MRITEGEYQRVQVFDEMGVRYYGIVVAIEDEKSLDSNFTEFSDEDFYIHVRFDDTHTDQDIIDNYPEERIVDANEDNLKPPVIRIRWESVEKVLD